MKPTNLSACKRIFTLLILLFSIGATVNAQPLTANFTANQVAGCSPLIVSFQDQSTGGPAVWHWNFGNGNTSALQNPTATYFTPGTYTVTLTVSNNGNTNTITRTEYVTIYDGPGTNFSANTTSGCFPLRVQFNDHVAGTSTNNVSWLWDFGNGVTSTAQHPLVTFNTGVFCNLKGYKR